MILCGVVTQKAIIRETGKKFVILCGVVTQKAIMRETSKKIRDSMRCSNPEGYNEGDVEENS